jgi:hypothetical protein
MEVQHKWQNVLKVLDEHENLNKEPEEQRTRMHLYDWTLNTIEYANSESSSVFFYNPCVERQLCIVNRGYAIVTKQQWGDQTNKFCSTEGTCKVL